MYLDYSELEFDRFGRPEQPELLLKTMSGDVLGVIPGVHNLHFNIKFSEPSEISFDLPAMLDADQPNPLYDAVCGYRQIYTKHYGVYAIMNPETESDGLQSVKHVTGYSIEKNLETKRFFLEEGTFRFYNQTDKHDENTVIGRILEIAPDWDVGYISPAVAQRYRTFDQYDEDLLSFVYNEAAEKFRCVFVFEPYGKKFSVYDADAERSTLQIYLDFDNLVTGAELTEQTEDVRTAMRPYGADGLDIRAVNPTGTNWIYDLSYFIENGDIPAALAAKWQAWQRRVLNRKAYYKGLVALQSSASAEKLSAQAKLTDLNGERDNLVALQNTAIQAMAMAPDAPTETEQRDKAYWEAELGKLKTRIDAKQQEIDGLQDEIDGLDRAIADYGNRIGAVNTELSLRNTENFTAAEYAVLSKYFIETDLTEDTFVATDVDTSVSGNSYALASSRFAISGAAVTRLDLTQDFSKYMYAITGGSFAITGGAAVTGDVIRGTLEVAGNNTFVMSMYVGASSGTIGQDNLEIPSGMITVTGTLSGLSTDVQKKTVDEVVTYEGTRVSFNCAAPGLYLTANVSDYQKYSVQMELYDFAVSTLSDLAVPTYEFSIESGNFLFERDFAPYRNELRLGGGVYLNLGQKRMITPLIIEIEFDFEDLSKFSIIFSNRFKRYDQCNTLKDLIEKNYSASRTINANKYIYNQTANQATAVSNFMNSALIAAVNTIKNAENQTVEINGNGISIGGNGRYQMRLVDRMLAITEDNWETAKMAIGLFQTDDTGEYFGVNAEVIAGKLIVGHDLIIENATKSGVMQFKVDASGAWLNNSEFILQKDNGGKIMIDPMYGIVAGNGSLYTVNGTTVFPSFIKNGQIETDADGLPTNANFFLDLRDGNAYFRGKVKATSGEIGGFTLESDYMHSGSGVNYVAMNGSGTNANSAYAFWAGNASPAQAKFWVKKDGTLSAKGATFTEGSFGGTLNAAKGTFAGDISAASGTFKGTVQAADFKDANGNSMLKNGKWSSNYLDLGNITLNGTTGDITMSGNITMGGSINLSGASSITWGSNTPTKYQFSVNGTSNWHNTMAANDMYRRDSNDGGKTWGTAYQFRGTNGKDGQDGSDADVTYNNIKAALQRAASTQTTFITADSAGAPSIYGGKIYGAEFHGNDFNVYPEDNSTGGYHLYAMYNGKAYEMYAITYTSGVLGFPEIHITSPAEGYMYYGDDHTSIYFRGNVFFNGASVKGIDTTAVFG